jgi:hypothetical protein
VERTLDPGPTSVVRLDPAVLGVEPVEPGVYLWPDYVPQGLMLRTVRTRPGWMFAFNRSVPIRGSATGGRAVQERIIHFGAAAGDPPERLTGAPLGLGRSARSVPS